MALNEHDLDIAERVSSLETDMVDLKGNGQPGRVGKLESAVTKLNWIVALGIGGLYVIFICASQGWLTFTPKQPQQQSNYSKSKATNRVSRNSAPRS